MATTSDYLEKLIAQKNALADNLVTKGVTATHNETLETLIPKVLNIEGGSSITYVDGDLSYVNYQNQIANNTVLGFIGNALYSDIYTGGGCGYNLASDVEKNRLVITKTYGDYNLTHAHKIDFTEINKIIVHGAIKSNLSGLTSTAYCYIGSEICNEINENWNVLDSTTGTSLLDFAKEIDCSQISGNNYLHLAIVHGTESSVYTSFFYIDEIEFL